MFDLIKNKKVFVSHLSVACITAALVLIITRNGNVSQTEPMEEDIPLVRTMVVASEKSGQKYVYSGEVRGRYESKLAFQVGGKIISRLVELGDKVEKGARLMRIDSKDIEQLVTSQSAVVASAKSQLELAEKELNRYRSLFDKDVISRAQLDRYETAYEKSLAGYRSAVAQQTKTANQLSYCTLYADRSGVVASIRAEAGQVVGPGQPVITLIQDGEQEIEINVPENRLQILHDEPQIRISFWALPDVTGEGKIREIAPMADPVTRTYKVRASLVEQIPQINLGMTASVEIAPDKKEGFIFVPISSLYQTEDTPCVWIVQGEILELRRIKVGKYGADGIQVVGGLKPGETIVTAGVHKLREGQRVKILGGSQS